MSNRLRLFGLALAGAMSVASTAEAAPILINGTLTFTNNPINYFNPANGYVPGGTSNASGLPVAISGGVEFGYNDGGNIDFADFTGKSLFISNISYDGAYDFVMTFTANRTGFFNNAVLDPNGFNGVMKVNSAGTVLTFTSPRTLEGGFAIRAAGVSFLGTDAPVPEPATWAMMIAGFGLVGAAMRRGKLAPRITYA